MLRRKTLSPRFQTEFIKTGIDEDPVLNKYWHQRYRLFSRYDDGIQIDRESWYTVTPEEIAKEQAEICGCDVMCDPFCGVGGNVIQFALTCSQVIAIDNNPTRLEMCRINCRLYNVEHKVHLILGDSMKLFPYLRADAIFLSPPWGGPFYQQRGQFDLNHMLPYSGVEVFQAARRVTPNICFFCPRNIDTGQLRSLTDDSNVQITYNWRGTKLKAITAYYGRFSVRAKSLSFCT